MITDRQDQITVVKMNVVLRPGQEPSLMSQNYVGKKGRSNCRAAARNFYQMTGQPTEVYQMGGPSTRPRYYYVVTGSAIPTRGTLITRYGALPISGEQENLYA